MNSPDNIVLNLKDEAATSLLAQDLILALLPGDLVRLSGDLGAGKTTLARAMIRSASGDAELEVPSPTFTLVQHYDCPTPWKRIAHFDLYRVETPDEIEELGLDDAQDQGIVLVEWPERGGRFLPDDGLTVTLVHDSASGHEVSINGNTDIMQRVRRSLALRNFLADSWDPVVERRFLLGDASTRAYETAHLGSEKRIVMNAPPMPDGPVIRDGKPYSQIAHLAEDVRPYVAITRILRNAGFNAPEIYAENLDQGFLLIEYLGSEGVIGNNGVPDAEKYLTAAGVLAKLHTMDWPRTIELDDGSIHRIPDYDPTAMMIEVDLLIRWYAPRVNGRLPADNKIKEYENIWVELIEQIAESEKSLVLRDYHSPNLLWQAHRRDGDRIGLIDFQDAMIGPSAYDLASLAQDARVTVAEELEQRLLDAYIALRNNDGTTFDEKEFRQTYAIMAAQRSMKLIGLWIRLDERDGKPTYLDHLPRTKSYLARALRHPVLAQLKDWLQQNIASG